MVWAVAKGSAVNKLILVPAALAISAFAPWAVTPLLMLGGAFLCFEGVEKLAHKYLHDPAEDEAHHAALTQALVDPTVDLVALEKDKIKGAVRTDFILSAEIIVISLGAAAGAPIGTQAAVLSVIAVAMTIGVYGLVAGIVKLDDLGLWLSRKSGAVRSAGPRHPGLCALADEGACRWPARRPCSWSAAASWCTASRRCTTWLKTGTGCRRTWPTPPWASWPVRWCWPV